MSRKEVMAVLGVGRRKLETLIDCGLLTPRHARIDETGRPRDRAFFRTQEVEAIMGETRKAECGREAE